MNIGKPQRRVQRDPLEEPAPLRREEPVEQPQEQPVKREEPVHV